MLPALPADGEAEAVRDSINSVNGAPGRKAASPHRRREHRESQAMPTTPAKLRQPDTKA